MLAPDKSDRGVSEIANDVLELFLSDAKAEATETAKAVEDRGAKEAIMWTAGVGVAFDAQSTIRTLRTLVETGKPLYGYQKENITALESVRDSIEELQSALRTMPSRAWLLLFATELTGGESENEIPSLEIQNRAKQRTTAISGFLAGMRARCVALLKTEPGKHRAADWVQQLCCDSAWDFLLRQGKQPTKTNSADSLFRKVARLFYEGVTGTDIDLEHSCRQTFERRQKKSLNAERNEGRDAYGNFRVKLTKYPVFPSLTAASATPTDCTVQRRQGNPIWLRVTSTISKSSKPSTAFPTRQRCRCQLPRCTRVSAPRRLSELIRW